MRIVIVTPVYPPKIGVLATYAEGIERGLKERGHTVKVVVSRLALPVGIRHVVDAVRIAARARGADYILPLDTWSVGLSAYAAASLIGVPCAFRVGGDALWESYVERTREPVLLSEWYLVVRPLSLKEKLMHRWFAFFTHRSLIFFNSRFQRDIWKRAYSIPEERVEVLENYYPPFVPAVARAHVFRAASRGAFFKNHDVLAHAFARAKENNPAMQLDTEVVPFEEQKRRLRECYAVIVPSLSEVNSNTVIEAASFGKPFIMSSDSGMSEWVRSGGICIDTRSEEAQKDAITEMMKPEVYERLQQSIVANWRERSWNAVAEDIERALSRRKSGEF